MSKTMNGKVTIEVSDATTGEVKRRHQEANYIHPLYLQCLNWIGQYGAFRSRGDSETFLSDVDAFQQVPFAGLLLTDNTDPTAPDSEILPTGEVLGHARIGVDGSGTLRGNYNASESIHTFDHHKLVYDFNTDQANGFFSSVYTGPFNATGQIVPFALAHLEAEGAERRILHYDEPGQRFVAHGYQAEKTSVGVIDVKDFLNSLGAPLEMENVTLSSGTFTGFVIVGSRWYWTAPATADSVTVYSAPYNDLQAYREETVLAGNNNAYLSHDGDNFLVGRQNGTLTFYDNSWSEVARHNFPDGGVTGNDLRFVRGWFPGVYSSAAGVHHTISTGSTTSDSFVGAEFAGFGSFHPLTDMFGLHVASHSSVGFNVDGLDLIPRPQFFSRQLIDGGVTKTEADVMKITYEFQLPTNWEV